MKILKKTSLLSLIIALVLVFNISAPMLPTANAALLGIPSEADFTVSGDIAINNNTAGGVELSWGAGPGGTTKYKVYRRLPVAQGTLSGDISGSNPASDILIAGAQDQTVSEYSFTATGEDFIINKLTVINDTTGAFDTPVNTAAVAGVDLICLDHFGMTATYTGALAAGSVVFSGLDCLVETSGPATITIRADVNSMAAVGEGLSGQGFRLGLMDTGLSSTYFNAAGQTSFIMENTPTISNGSNVNPFVVRKSKPTFAKASGGSTTLNNGENTFYGLEVTADSAGSISFGRIIFNMTTSGLASGGTEDIHTFRLYRGANLINANHVNIWCMDDLGNNAIDVQNAAVGSALELCDDSADDGIPDGTYKIIVAFDAEETISQGASQTYYLKGTVMGATSNDSAVTSVASGDDNAELTGLTTATTPNTGKIYVDATAASGIFTSSVVDFSTTLDTGKNILWSDKSADTHSYPTVAAGSVTSDTGSYDWTNGYLLDAASIPDHSMIYMYNDPLRMYANNAKQSVGNFVSFMKSKASEANDRLLTLWNTVRGVEMPIPGAYADTTTFTEIAETTGTGYDDITGIDEPNTDYDYIIEALDNSNVVQGYSNVLNLTYTEPAITITSAVTGDSNSDGTVDQIQFNFSENVDIVDDAGSSGLEASLVLSNSCVIATSDYDSTNVASLTVALTGCTAGTDLIPSVVYTKVADCTTDGSICDNAVNTLMSTHSLTANDGAKPAPLSATFYDGDANGTLDLITVVWSENINAVADGSADWAISSASDFIGLSEGVVECNSGSAGANECDYNFTAGNIFTGAGDLTLAYTAGSVTDGTNSADSITFTASSSPAFTDTVKPQRSITEIYDSNGDQKADQIRLDFSEPVTFTYDPNDWAFTIPGDMNLGGDFQPGDCTGSGTKVITCTDADNSHFTADADKTGRQTAGGSLSYWTYTNNSNNVTDDTNHLDTVSDMLLADNLKPYPLSATLDYFTGVLIINFTEAVDADPGTNIDLTKVHINNVSGNNSPLTDLTASGPAVVTASETTSVTITLSSAQKAALLATSGVTGGDGQANVLDIEQFVFGDTYGNSNLVDLNNTITESLNVPPTASSVTATGTLRVGQLLTGNYTYADVDTDAEGTSTFVWYRSDDASGTNKAAIGGATAGTYTLVQADSGKYISFEVTPVAATGDSPGVAVESAKVGFIANKPVMNTTSNAYFDTIQAGINAANNGEVLMIADGTYTENLTINKGVNLWGNTGSPANVTITGTHTITTDDVIMQGMKMTPGSGVADTVVTIDSSATAIDGVTLSFNTFEMDTSPSVGVFVGGTCTNAVSNISMVSNTFNGPTNMISNPWKIGGSFGSPASCEVSNLNFELNTVNKGSIPINLQNSNLTNIEIKDNTFANTDGALYVWAQSGSSPTGVLSDFAVTGNTFGSTNNYGVAFIDQTAAAAPFTDANFGTGNQFSNNSFSNIIGAYGLDALYFFGTYTTYSLEAKHNWWSAADGPSGCLGCGGSGDAISNDINYMPYYTDAGKTTLSDVSYTSSTTGQADLPAGVTDVELDDNTVLDVSGGVDTAAAGSITVGGSSLTLNNFTSGDLAGEDLSTAQTVGTATVTVNKAVKLESGTNGQPINLTNSNLATATVAIPDGTTAMGPSGWTGTILPPKAGTTTGTAPSSSFTVGSSVVEVGSPDGVLLFDQPVSVIIDGVHSYVGYRPANSTVWTQITATCAGTYASPTAPTFPGECFITDAGLSKTKIYTYHMTTFGNLSAVTPATPVVNNQPSGGGGGGGSIRVSIPSDSNTKTSDLSSTISSMVNKTRTVSRSMKISTSIIETDAVSRTKTAKLTDENGEITLKPNKDSTISVVIPKSTTVTSDYDWDGKIDPPLVYNISRVSKNGGVIINSSDKLYRENVVGVVRVGSGDSTLTFSNKVKMEVPLDDVEDGTVLAIYSSPFGFKWTYEGNATVSDEKVEFDTDHFSYFALEDTGKAEAYSPISSLVDKTTGFTDISSHWAYSYIVSILDKGIVSGKTSTTYAPDDNITRAELTKIAINAFDFTIPETVDSKPFTDVDTSAWYASYVDIAKDEGIVQGVGTKFMPNDYITRAAALKILIEAAEFEGVYENYQTNYALKDGWWYVHFPDVLIGEWYARYVAYAKDYSIVGGYSDGTFKPGNYITRAEVAKIVTKILDLAE